MKGNATLDFRKYRHGRLIGRLMLATLLAGASAQAQQTDYNTLCMGDRAKASGGFNLNCTANDVRLAKADEVTILDDGCKYPGDTVSFTARMTVETTATERYDVGIYFATDGQGTAMNGGKCSVSILPTDSPFYNIDPAPDTCGDIGTKRGNPLYPVLTFTNVTCQDRNTNGKLDLPYCTSWRQTGSNEICTKPADAYPGAPSKCKCDSTFEITDIDVPPASFDVTKTATPTVVNEPGELVVFDVSVKNSGLDPNNPTTLNTLSDNIYGSITTVHGDVTATTCKLPQTIAAGGTYSCSFTAWVKGQGNTSQTDIVTATGVDSRTPPNTVKGSDDATVAIKDVLPAIEVDKSVSPSSRVEPGGDFTFTVKVTNTSLASTDDVTIDSLTDDIYGNLDGKGTCNVPTTISPGAYYSCTFTVSFTGNAGKEQTDVVTASGTDDEKNPVSGFDSANISLSDYAAAGIDVQKVAVPESVYEPGGSITFGIAVQNLSTVDTVKITSLTDDKFGDLGSACGVPFTLTVNDSAAGGTDIKTCTITRSLTGKGNTSHTNTVTASGTDDDGAPVSDSDDATVTFLNVAPAASLTKRVTSVVATYEVVVKNESSAESLQLTALVDDKFGDLAGQGTCTVSQTLAPKGSPGDSYTCTFEGKIDKTPHTDTVTGTVEDDDGSTAVKPSDSATVSWE